MSKTNEKRYLFLFYEFSEDILEATIWTTPDGALARAKEKMDEYSDTTWTKVEESKWENEEGDWIDVREELVRVLKAQPKSTDHSEQKRRSDFSLLLSLVSSVHQAFQNFTDECPELLELGTHAVRLQEEYGK